MDVGDVNGEGIERGEFTLSMYTSNSFEFHILLLKYMSQYLVGYFQFSYPPTLQS